MKYTTVTNLEEFCLSEIYRPYQSIIIPNTKRLEKLTEKWSLENAVKHLEGNDQWAAKVMLRIQRCRYKFPSYINHPLVDELKKMGMVK